jgi:hypothetical protein
MVRLLREAYGLPGSFFVALEASSGDLFFELLVRQRKEGSGMV